MKGISIIIPVYNAEKYLDRCICSILDQEFTSYEVILVDDGSTDSSYSICEHYSSSDTRFRVLHKTNGGVSSARNTGIEAARGDRLMFLDVDDVLSPDALETMAKFDSDLVVAGFRKVVSGRTIYVRQPDADRSYSGLQQMSLFLDDVIGGKECRLLNSACFKLFRTEVVRSAGLRFEEQLRYGEDKMFVFDFLCHASSASTVASVVYDYVLQQDSLSSDEVSDGHLEQIFKLMEAYAPVLDVLIRRFPESVRVSELYHVDMIGRYVCRVLTALSSRRSTFLTDETIRRMYEYMDKDSRLTLFSIRLGQILNILLYKAGSVSFTRSFYKLTSFLFSLSGSRTS